MSLCLVRFAERRGAIHTEMQPLGQAISVQWSLIINLITGTELVKFFISSNDWELYWSYALIIYPAGFVGHGGLNKNATMARWSLMISLVLLGPIL
jgi:hypothetical protein